MTSYTAQSLEKVLSDPKTVAINRLPPRSYYLPSESVRLNGEWDFRYDQYISDAPLPSNEIEFPSSIQVPGHWQLQGFGSPNYTNVQYPFNVNVPYPPKKNPTGTYRRFFKIPDSWKTIDHLRLRFEGVDCSYHVFLNGKLVGYSEGSRNAAEFDISEPVKPGNNELWVRVYQWSCSTYIEDQDQWWLSGIFRDVWVLGFSNSGYIEDFKVVTDLDAQYQHSNLDLTVNVNATEPNLTLKVELSDSDQKQVLEHSCSLNSSELKKSFLVNNPRKWTAEDPFLYSLRLTLKDGEKRLSDITQQVGFRKVEMLDGLLQVNGRPILLRGTNRHDHHPKYGRAVPLEFIEHDLRLMKEHNINAIRTSHYPNTPELYHMANKYGFWVFEEADLECHGFFECVRRPIDASDDVEYKYGKRELFQEAKLFTSDNPEWEQAYVDRATQLVRRDLNNPCVIVWSLGNEAFYGKNHVSMANAIRKLDPTRPIHYEGDLDAETADMYSRMYPSFDTMLEFVNQNQKPLVLCEYGHAMGNGPGLIRQYQELFYKYRQFQGGFIWEWNNHGIEVEQDGNIVYCYGGDFDEPVNDGVFCMDGLVNSKHEPTPGLIEYKKVIEPIIIEFDDKNIIIKNTFDFVNLSEYVATYSITGYGNTEKTVLETGHLQISEVPSHHEKRVPMPLLKASYPGMVILMVEFRTRYQKPGLAKDHLVSWAQHILQPKMSAQILQPKVELDLKALKTGGLHRVFNQEGFECEFNDKTGSLEHLKVKGVPILEKGHNNLSFWRAEINNDKPVDGPYWKKFGLDQMRINVTNVDFEVSGDIKIKVDSFMGPPVSSWRFKSVQNYVISNNGLSVHTILKPEGFNKECIPKYLPRLGYEFTLADTWDIVKWFGRGPGESYPDKKESQLFDIHGANFDQLDYSYDYPQENGNHEDTKWLTLKDKEKSMIIEMEEKSFGFKCSREYDLDKADHPHGIKHGPKYVRIDYKQHGVGTEACGPGVLDPYKFFMEDEFEFEIRISLDS